MEKNIFILSLGGFITFLVFFILLILNVLPPSVTVPFLFLGYAVLIVAFIIDWTTPEDEGKHGS